MFDSNGITLNSGYFEFREFSRIIDIKRVYVNYECSITSLDQI